MQPADAGQATGAAGEAVPNIRHAPTGAGKSKLDLNALPAGSGVSATTDDSPDRHPAART